MAMGVDFPRKECSSLQLLCQVAVIKILHQKAIQIDISYQIWLERSLGIRLRAIESMTDVRFVDAAKVVRDFQSTMNEKTEPEPKPTAVVTRSQAAANKKAELESKLQKKKKRQMRGIPPNVLPKDYILYKKCHYMETINEIGRYLASHLSPALLNDLMMTSYNISLYNDTQEGVVTLTAMLTTRATSLLLTKYIKHLATCWIPGEDDSSLSYTILHRSILNGNNLVNISLYSFCRDFILRSIAMHARNLKHLNVTDAKITEDGLFYLCGFEKQDKRAPKPSQGTRTPYRANSNMGCFKLEHFEATHVLTSAMPDLYPLPRDSKNLPESSPFVLMLQKMENLRVFLVSYGCLAVATFARRLRKKRQQKTLKLQIVADDRPCEVHMICLARMCPDLKQIVLCFNQKNVFVGPEEWVKMLNSVRVVSIISKGVCFHTPNFCQTMLDSGKQLTHLDFDTMTYFKYSYLRAIKKGCPNLIEFNLVMSGPERTYSRINLVSDGATEKPQDEHGKLSKLQSFMVFGPFRCHVIEFMLHGATSLKSLSLGIDYMDPILCPLQADTDDDYLGKSYLRKVLSSNKMDQLEELHLHSSSLEGRKQLDKSCGEFVLKMFPKLRHLGNFMHWNISVNDRRQIIANHHKGNRSFLFDDELFSEALFEEQGYTYKCFPGRMTLCCNRISFRHGAYGVISTLFEAFGGDNGFLNLMGEVVVDDSDQSDEDDIHNFNNGIHPPVVPFLNFPGMNDPFFGPVVPVGANGGPNAAAQAAIDDDALVFGPPPEPNDQMGPLMEVFANDFNNQCVLM